MLRDQAAIELRHLRYFLAVMEELHFGRAADRLEMAQPPLSRAIRRLEESLGVQLLTRSSRAVVPTAAGIVFAEEARKVLAGLEQAVSVARHAGGASSELRIGCVFHLAPDLLHRFLGGLAAAGQDITTQVTHIASLEQVRRLRAGELDVAIFLEVGDQPDIAFEPIFPGEPLAAFLAVSHPLARRTVIAPADVAGETLILFPRAVNPALHDWTRALIEGAGFRFADVLEATSHHPRDAMVLAAQGRGVYISLAHLGRETGADRLDIATLGLEPPLVAPEPKLGWLATAPDGHHRRLDVARDVARSLYRQSG